MDATKKPWLSKTLWVNLALCICALAWPDAQEYISTHPDVVAVIFTAINVILRLVTTTGIQITDDKAAVVATLPKSGV